MKSPPWSPELFRRALRFAAEAHAAQKVPGSERPYVTHVTEVAAEVLAAIAVEPVERPDLAVLAALLHDTVEDTHVTVESIAAIFGAPVARAVAALTKDSSLPAEERMSDSLRRILAEPPEVAMVKLADRIVNLAEPPPTWSYEKRSAYQREARSIAATLGHVSATLDARLRAKIDAYDRFIAAREA